MINELFEWLHNNLWDYRQLFRRDTDALPQLLSLFDNVCKLQGSPCSYPSNHSFFINYVFNLNFNHLY